MKTLSRFLVDQAVAVLAPKLQQALFHHVRLSLASRGAAIVDPTTTPYQLGSALAREHSLASDLQMRSSGRRRHSCATAGPTRAAVRRHVYASAITDRRDFNACATNSRSVRVSQRSSRVDRIVSLLFAWARTPTCLLSSSTRGVAAPDLVGRRSRPRCKSTP